MTNVQVKCKCGKMANETDWNNEQESQMLFDKFGSLDDYYFFICECGEIISMHYTGYDSLLEAYEFETQQNEDTKCLHANGNFIGSTSTVKEFSSLLLDNYSEIHSINDGYETMTYYRNGATFIMVVFNPVHKTYQLLNYKAHENCVQNLLSHFFKS